jgi:hypothetical protein
VRDPHYGPAAGGRSLCLALTRPRYGVNLLGDLDRRKLREERETPRPVETPGQPCSLGVAIDDVLGGNSHGEIMSEVALFPLLWLGDPNRPKETWLCLRCNRSLSSTGWPFTLELGKRTWAFDLAMAKDIGDAIWTIDYRRGLIRLGRAKIRLGPVFRCMLDFGDDIKNVIEFGLCDATDETVVHFYFVFGEHRYQGPLDEADDLICALRTFGEAVSDISEASQSVASVSAVV